MHLCLCRLGGQFTVGTVVASKFLYYCLELRPFFCAWFPHSSCSKGWLASKLLGISGLGMVKEYDFGTRHAVRLGTSDFAADAGACEGGNLWRWTLNPLALASLHPPQGEAPIM